MTLQYNAMLNFGSQFSLLEKHRARMIEIETDDENCCHYAGQFYHGIEYEVTDMRPGVIPEKPDATMYVKGHELNVTRYTRLPD